MKDLEEVHRVESESDDNDTHMCLREKWEDRVGDMIWTIVHQEHRLLISKFLNGSKFIGIRKENTWRYPSQYSLARIQKKFLCWSRLCNQIRITHYFILSRDWMNTDISRTSSQFWRKEERTDIQIWLFVLEISVFFQSRKSIDRNSGLLPSLPSANRSSYGWPSLTMIVRDRMTIRWGDRIRLEKFGCMASLQKVMASDDKKKCRRQARQQTWWNSLILFRPRSFEWSIRYQGEDESGGLENLAKKSNAKNINGIWNVLGYFFDPVYSNCPYNIKYRIGLAVSKGVRKSQNVKKDISLFLSVTLRCHRSEVIQNQCGPGSRQFWMNTYSRGNPYDRSDSSSQIPDRDCDEYLVISDCFQIYTINS
jgi:hypothetical protein